MKPAELDTELTETNRSVEHVEVNGKTHLKERPITWGERIKNVLLFFTVEPFLLCFIVPVAFSFIAINRLNTEKACRVDLNYTEEICTNALDGLTENDNITKVAQLEALLLVTDMQTWQSPVQSSVPAILVLFVGAWSDRSGNRKALMLIPLLGEMISSLGLILATYFFLEWPLWVTALIQAVPTALTGGQTIALMGSYSYIADLTTVESRTFRIGLVAVIVTLGFPFGTSISGTMTKHLGYYGVFGTQFALYVIGFLYTILRIHDVKIVETTGTAFQKMKEFFHPKNIWDTVSIIIQSHRRQRTQIILVLCAHIVIMGPVFGEAYILFQYTLAKYNMDGEELSWFITYTVLLSTTGTAIAITIFSKYLKMHDTILGIIATVCKTISSFVFGVAPTKMWLYSAPVFDIFGNSGVTAIRSLGTKVVDPENIAKMCSLIGFAENITPMVYGPMYTQIFSKTFEVLPGAVYFVGSVMTIPAFFIFVALFILVKRQERDVVKNPASKETHAHDNDVTAL